MAEKKRKTCQICGCSFVPASNVQKYCPECKYHMQKDGSVKDAFVKYQQARKPGEVKSFTLKETPEDAMQQPETPERPALPEGWEEAQKAIELPDGLAVIEEHAEILRRYYKGELVDKNEFLARIQEKLGEF